MNNLKTNIRSSNYLPFILLVAMVGCTPPLYFPSARHTHLLDKKGEFSGGVHAGSNGIDV